MLNGRNWSVEYREVSAEVVKAKLATNAAVPGEVKALIVAALDALPADRGDLGVMVNASGHLGLWDEYREACEANPAHAGGIAKPQGFMSLWVGYTNSGGAILR